MNRYIKYLCMLVLALLTLCLTAYAQNVEVQINGKTDYGTISAENAKFTVRTDLLSKESYNVKVMADGKQLMSLTFTKPENVKERQFSFTNLTKGIHNITITVFDASGNALCAYQERLCITEPYTHQFMDELSGRGVNVHFEGVNYKKNENAWVSAVKNMGLKTVRMGIGWNDGETYKGNYDSIGEKMDNISELLNLNGLKVAGAGSGWCNKLYPPEDGVLENQMYTGERNTITNFAKTPESLKAYGNYLMKSLDYSKNKMQNDRLQIANEPNLESFNSSIIMPFNDDKKMMAGVYADVFNSVGAQLKRNGYDWVNLGGPELAAYKDDFAELLFQYGSYPFMNSFSYHPYPEKNAFLPPYNENSPKIYVAEKYFSDLILKYGGWKNRMWTETGFSTYSSSNPITEDEAAEGAVKTFAYADLTNVSDAYIYQLLNDGADINKKEDNWGMFTDDMMPKKSVPAVTYFNTKTNGATLVGNIDLNKGNGTKCLVYNKDGKPMLFAWTDSGTFVKNFEGTDLKVTDIYGNIVSTSGNNVVIGNSPVYIENADAKYFALAAKDTISELNSVWKNNYLSKLNTEISNNVNSHFAEIESIFGDGTTEQQALNAIETYKNMGNEIIALGKNGSISELETSQMLYELFRPLEFAVNFYISAYTGAEPSVSTAYDTAYESAKQQYKNDICIKQYSNEILNYAKKYSDKTKVVASLESNPTKSGVISGWNKMTEVLCEWFNGISEFEKIINYGLQIQIPHYNKVAYTQTRFNLNMNLTNYSLKDFSGTIVCYNQDGEKIAETERFELAADCNTIKKSLPIIIPNGEGYQRMVLKYINDDKEETASQIVDINVKKGFSEKVSGKVYTHNSVQTVEIIGRMDNLKNYDTREISLLVKDESGNLYVDQTTIDDNGGYSFKFQYSGDDVEKADIILNVGGAVVNDTVVERISELIKCNVTASEDVGIITVVAELENYYDLNETCMVVVAGYDAEGKLSECYLSDIRQIKSGLSNEVYSMKAPNVENTKIFVWNDAVRMRPLASVN